MLLPRDDSTDLVDALMILLGHDDELVAYAARRGLSLCVEGGVERLWLRTHFRALRLLLLCATHDNLCSFSVPPTGFPC